MQLNIDLRNDSGEPLQMTSIERTIYLPLIISVLKLLNRIQHLVPDDARDLLEEALGRVDGALAQLAKNEESQGAPPLR